MVDMILHGDKIWSWDFPLLGYEISQTVATWGDGHGWLASASITTPGPPCRTFNGRGWLLPGGTQIWVGQGCAARASKPLPIFKGDFGRKGYPFLRIFLEKWAHFSKISQFLWFLPCGLSQKSWPMFKDFFYKKRDPCLRISCKKATH